MSKSIALGWVGAGAVLLAILLLMAVSSVFTLHVPVAAQGISPTATTTPALTSAPIPAPVSTAPPDATDDGSQPDGLFYEVDGEPPPSIGVDTLASRLVGIDLGQLAQVIESPFSPKDPVTGKPTKPQALALNLFDDVVFTGLVEHIEPTASGHALWGGLEGVELGTMTLVVNGSVVVGTVRTPDAVYTIRTAAAGAYVVRQIDEASLPPLGEPLRGSIPEPDSPPPVRPQVRGPDAPDGTSTPTSTPTPVPTAPTSPSKPAPDEAMASGLFSEVEGDPPPSPGVDTLASRLVEIDFGQLSQLTKSPVGPKDPVTGKPTEPQALVLNLFDDVVLTGIVEHVEPTSSGHSLWGRLDGVGLGTFTLVVNGRMVIGTVRMPDAVYTIRTAGDGTYVIRQIDESSLPPLGEPLEPPLSPLSPRDAPAEADDVPSDDGSEIDVMVVYTPLAKHLVGGRAAIEALIDLFVAETNQAYAISGVIHRINLMLREEVDYTEDGDSIIDLGRLSNGSDGYMDDVHERRDMYGADLVHIRALARLHVVGKSDYGGRAYFNRGDSAASDEPFGFGLTVSRCGGLCFAHELGHNMGLNHDRYQLGVPRTGSHYGYVNQRVFEPNAPESALWHTIMAYPSQCWEVAEYYCERIGYFSNPENNYNGDPMGVPADHPSTGVDGPADAVRTLNDRREITANFRQSSASPSPRVHLTLSPYWLSENGGVSKVTATLHRPSSADTTVTILASPSDAVTLSGSRTLTIPAGQTVSGGTVTITGVDNGDQTGDVIVSVSATAANTSSLGVVDPEPVALVIADAETTPVVTLSLSPSEIAEHEGLTFVTATLGNRSGTDTTVTVSAEPADAVEEISSDPLTIPAGQTENIGFGVWIQVVDNDELAEATQTVTVSGTSENAQGVAGPENVTLTIIDDEAPFFAADSIAYTFTAGIAGSRFLPEAEFGNGKLTYSLSPAPSNDVTFTPEPPARIGVSATSVAAGETSYTLTATDADGDTDTMTISITVRKGVCPNSAAVSGYSDPGIVHDCEALLASRDTLSVDQSLNWDEDLPIDEWKGVELANGRVVELRMSSEGIVGAIPSELGNLSNLQGLSLWGNRLTGGIPKELGNLANLRWLWLSSGNQLTGGIPEELGSLSNLQSLDLWGNQLTGVIPKELGNLANLRSLWLHGNQLTGVIPKELGNLAQLEGLLLQGNQLTGVIPKELGNLSNLQELDLSDNRLTGSIAKELGNLSNLQKLYLGGNLLTGCVPDGLRDVPNNDFVSLGLPFCSEHPCVSGGAVVDATNEGLVSDCGMLLAARDTLAGTAALNWSADTPIADWTGVALGETSGRVTEILLGGMGLNGNIPKQLGSLTNLQSLDFSDNRLTGSIAAELLDLANLQELYLGGNLLTGCVPDGLRDVPNNDIARLGLPFCSEHPCVSGGAVVDATNTGLRSDCERLLAARDTLAGTASLNWSADTPITEWNGVVLGGTSGRVTELDLGALGLNGRIPKELGSLANLTHLYLDNNQLTGEIPPELGGLSNLRYLRLWSNQLTGEIPPELGHLSNLRHLWLWSNQLTGEIPPELGGLSNLRELALSGNQLTGEIPPELGRLSNLERLYLGNNRLTGCIPPRLRDVPDNDFSQLGLRFCPLSPPEASTISSVTSEMDSITISWATPLSDGGSDIAAYDLRHIETDDDETVDPNWTVVEDVWTSGGDALEYTLTGLTVGTEYDIQVRAVNAVGDGPWSATVTATLTTVSTCAAGVAVPDPTSNPGLLAVCESLLTLLDTLVEGTVLNWSADIPISEWDGIEEDSLEGTPPQVVRLYLGGLGLDGAVPSELSGLTELKELYLQDNDLSGPVPVELGDLSSLTHLHLQNNDLTGGIPAELGDLAVLRELRLDNNDLTGQLPPELGSLIRVTRLWVADNDLSGSIPAELGDMANLDWLNLGRNNFSGQIPAELGNLSRMRRLYIYENDLSGPIPGALGSLSRLTHIVAQANDLSGEIPEELGSLANLVWMGLHDNDLTGEIPAELGGLAKLQRLYLTNNELYGEVPEELGDLSALTNLWLNHNYLSGQIPHSLDNLDKLSRLRLAGNRLTGCLPAGLAAVGNSDADQLGLETCADPAVGTEYGVQEKTASGAVAPKQAATGDCATGGAVPDAANNPGLVSDCEALLAAREALVGNTGNAELNWSADTPIREWDGIEEDSLEGAPPQVVRLYLNGLGLGGAIPSGLSGLTALKELYLHDNDLAGPIPPDLGNLSSLTHLNLQNNDLTGGIPAELGDLAVLRELRLHRNMLSGQIPAELGDLENLRFMWLHGNILDGSIPAELGDLTKLERLWLSENELSGQIPVELGDLSSHSLVQWWLSGEEHQFTGCLPAGLAAIADNDFDGLDLQVCTDS